MRTSAMLLLIAAFSTVLDAGAQSGTIAPGEYITERGWGHLVARRTASGSLAFQLEAVGANVHICSLDGEIRGQRATLDGEQGKPCVVTFAPKGSDVAVSSNGACRLYCGARAGFEDLYLKPAPGCGRAEMRRTRDEFKRLYDRKAYAQARAKLEPLLASCARTTGWLDDGWIRNDLAITMYRSGDLAGCRRVLAGFTEEARASDAEIRGNYPPSDAENYLPIISAARANLKVCGASLDDKR